MGVKPSKRPPAGFANLVAAAYVLFPMTLTLHLPDHAARLLQDAWDDLPRATLESLAVEGYRSGRLSCAQVGAVLGLASRFESEDFLARHGAWPGTTAGELVSDLATLDRLRGK